MTRPAGWLPDASHENTRRQYRRGEFWEKRRAARAARTKPHAGMYTQASTSKVAIMEWITIQVLSESWVMMRAPSKRWKSARKLTWPHGFSM